MSELWQKGAGSGQLRENVRVGSGMIYHRLKMRALEKAGSNEFEF